MRFVPHRILRVVIEKLSLPPAIFLMGPTACGKTDLAVHLVEKLPCDIISVDSAQVYKGMDIGTAKPTADVLARAPHRLIDFLDPAESYSAAAFCKDALREIQNIVHAGRIPLLVGGTMLYFHALRNGLADLPAADPQVRVRLDAEAADIGWPAMHEKLQSVDAESAACISPNDPQRLQRALEIYELSGEPMSVLLRAQQAHTLPCEPVELILMPGQRPLLHKRIAHRFDDMLEQGLVEEVEGLRRRADLHPGLPSIRAVGYRQVWNYLDGDLTHSEMMYKAVVATRQLAKRQMTWLRKEQTALTVSAESCDKDEVASRLMAHPGVRKAL